VEFSPQTHYWAETVIAPIRDETGATIGYLSIQTDITEQVMREQAEARRQELHALLTQLALTLQLDAPLGERLPQLLNALMERGAIGDSGALGFWERDGETLRLHTTAGVLHDHFQQSWRTLIAYEWDYDAPRAIQLSLQGRTVNAVVVPVRWMNQSLGMLLLVCDRCRLDRVGLDPVLREFLTDLGELVAMALMRERSRQALLNAKAEAERLAQARTEFLANMSHEIRTPMNGVLGMLNLLKDTPLTDEQRDLLQTAETSAQHLLEILNDILNLAKIEAGQMKLERTPTDLKRLVRETCEMVRPQARLKGILLREELPADELYALADPTRLRQILLNLLSNAVKFTERGEVVARLITREPSAENEHALRFEVQDTGIGIPPDKQQQIFEPFRQADGSTTRKYGGTGLGLAICKKLVKLMGGQMGVVSQVGEGSTFWFEVVLPVSEAPAHVRLEQQLRAAEQTPLTGLRVLVAEDNLVNQKVIRRTLEKWGIEAQIANNGREALEWLSREPFHLVLMDCQMPEIDGYEATRRIRAYEQPRGLHIPIIALTANALAGDREKCLECGMDDYLTKPVNPDMLWEKLTQWGLPRLEQTVQAA
jgi:signal transduction histidine kinase/ActR/RegA family two-component response regulator